jgi:hypothetical protein
LQDEIFVDYFNTFLSLPVKIARHSWIFTYFS